LFERIYLQFANVKLTILIIKSASHLSLNVTFKILKKINNKFALFQKEFIKKFDFIVIINFVNNELSSFVRHQSLRNLLQKKRDFMQHF